jgi:hypothetical protein
MRYSITLSAVTLWSVVNLLGVRPSAGQVDVLTQHNDNTRSGVNLHEATLNTSNVNREHFGKLAFRLVDGNVYAQPLVVSQMKVANRPGATNIVIIATEHNSVYAYDADDTNQASTTALLWHTGPDTLGPPVESTQLNSDIKSPGCADLTTEIGITGTPAIKITRSSPPREGVLFVAAKSRQSNKYLYTLYTLDLTTGKKLATKPIVGSVPGTGAGSIGSGANRVIFFDPMLELNRPGLLLADNTLYLAFGGHCDSGKYHGWLLAYDVSDPKNPKNVGVFCSTPNGKGSDHEGRAGIWMSGQGPAADDAGNIYFVTGDGTYNGKTDFGDSVIKVKLASNKLQVLDWFTPQNQDFLKNKDVDLGSSGVVFVPNSHLLLVGGKEGRLYLIDRTHMGKGALTALHSFQVTHQPDLRPSPPVFYNIHGTPVVWARPGEMFVYVNGEEDPLKQYRLIPDNGPGAPGWKFASDQPFKTSPESAPYPNFPTGMFGQPGRDPVWMPGGFLSLSANGDNAGTGILWVAMPYAESANHAVVRGVLRAYDALDVSKGELWDSENTGNGQDRLGQFAKFAPPTIANGKVYVGTFQQETIGNDGIHRKVQGGDQPALAIYGLR